MHSFQLQAQWNSIEFKLIEKKNGTEPQPYRTKLCKTFLNIAKHGEIMTQFNLPEPDWNRTDTGKYFN